MISNWLQNAVVLSYVLNFTLWPILSTLLTIALLFTASYYWISCIYIAWILTDVLILDTPARGGRRAQWCRRHWLWNYFRDYFPLKLVKTCDIDPSKKYIMGYHPHGVLSFGAMCSFASEATGFSEQFPGITPYLTTLVGNFKIPLLRKFLLYTGLCDVSKESIQWLLQHCGPGTAVVIVVGGAEEALEAHPNTYRLTLKHRQGFVRQAIKAGAYLIPMYSFGEGDAYEQVHNPKGSSLRDFQTKFKKTLWGISAPVFHGRGPLGQLPFRKPITTVVGSPIEVHQSNTLDQDTVDRVHAQYLQALTELFNLHKQTQGISQDATLEFV